MKCLFTIVMRPTSGWLSSSDSPSNFGRPLLTVISFALAKANVLHDEPRPSRIHQALRNPRNLVGKTNPIATQRHAIFHACTHSPKDFSQTRLTLPLLEQYNMSAQRVSDRWPAYLRHYRNTPQPGWFCVGYPCVC